MKRCIRQCMYPYNLFRQVFGLLVLCGIFSLSAQTFNKQGLDLQDRIEKANNGDTLEIDSTKSPYIGHFEIKNKSLTLVGTGDTPEDTILESDSTTRVLTISAPSNRVFINNLTIQGGTTTEKGGGIINSSNLELHSVIVQNNKAGQGGGGIANIEKGKLTIKKSKIQNNTSDTNGGGIRNHYVLIIEDSTISENDSVRGGGIYSQREQDKSAAEVTIKKCFIEHNQANRRGTSSDNQGGGIALHNTKCEISHTNLTSNETTGNGGGLFQKFSFCRFRSSTISKNKANKSGDGGGGDGGGIFFLTRNAHEVLHLTETVIELNRAANEGGGIYNATKPSFGIIIHSGVEIMQNVPDNTYPPIEN